MRLRPAIICVLLAPVLAQCGRLPFSFGEAGIGTGGAPAKLVSLSTSDAKAAAGLVSQYRLSKGLSSVAVDATLNRAAEVQARAVAEAGSLSHGDFGSRMTSFGITGYSAENLAAGSRTVEGAMAQWKGSPGHNRNLLLPQARRIGLARANSPGAGYETYWALVLAD